MGAESNDTGSQRTGKCHTKRTHTKEIYAGTVIRTAEYYVGAFETYGGRPPESLYSPPLPDDGATGLLRGRTGVPGAGGERRAPHGGADGPAGGGPLPADRHYENVKQRFETNAQTAVFYSNTAGLLL